MVLSWSRWLKEIPDLSNATSLEELNLHECKGLLELTSTIGYATKLKRCILSGCCLLKELPSFEGAPLTGCLNLEILSGCSSLKRLDLRGTAIREVPLSIKSYLAHINKLDMSGCRNLKELNLSESTGLKELTGCLNLEILSGCSSLKRLDLRGTAIREVPLSIKSYLAHINKLDMSGCRNLKEFPNVPASIEVLLLCKTSIEEIPPWIENLSHLRRLVMYGCEELKKISPNISKLENLEFLGLRKSGQSEHDKVDLKHVFEAVIKWEGADSKRSWTLISDLKVHYILPRCLPT